MGEVQGSSWGYTPIPLEKIGSHVFVADYIIVLQLTPPLPCDLTTEAVEFSTDLGFDHRKGFGEWDLSGHAVTHWRSSVESSHFPPFSGSSHLP